MVNIFICEFVVGGYELGLDRSILISVNVEEISKVNFLLSFNIFFRELVFVIDLLR